MKQGLLPVLVLLLLAPAALAAPASRAPLAPPDTLTEDHGWLADLVVSLNLAQSAYHNWQEGGFNTLAATSNVRGLFARVTGDFRQRHDARLALGLVKQDTFAVRKAVDVVRYALDLQHAGVGHFLPTFATELRTQFAAGFDYDPSPEDYPELAGSIVPGERLKVSDFFAPAFWTQSLGMAYEPGTWFRARAGLGLKETIVAIERLRPVYGNRPDQPVRVQAGLDGLLEARGEPFENVRVHSRLVLFQAFTQFSEAAPDIFWENTVQLRVNRWLSVNAELVAMYDRDVLDRIQLKEVLSVGLSFSLL